VTAGEDAVVRLWDTRTRRCVRAMPTKCAALCCDVNPDASYCAIGLADGSFAVHTLPDLRPVLVQPARKEAVSDVKFSPCGKYLAVGSHDNFIDVFDVTGTIRLVGNCSVRHPFGFANFAGPLKLRHACRLV
jgi:echinoderm microtubule-associated protein-like 6